ncbi:MAG: hypothetical protein FWF02_08365 [Micrococcales bacterium]|nr:hypothetical protein [Micrococcales bacterium]MCL2667703.1 hypothetical protein [Micrococcales bacterium]
MTRSDGAHYAGVGRATVDQIVAETLRHDPPGDHESTCTMIATLAAADLTAAELVVVGLHAAQHQALAAKDPEAHSLGLAQALSSYAVRLEHVGQTHDALKTCTTAVSLWEPLAASDPTHNHGLAMELNNQGCLLADTGRQEEALAASGRSVTLREALVAHDPGTHDADFAAALTNHSRRLAENQQFEQSLAVSHRAVAIHEERVACNAAPTPCSATALNNHAIRLYATRRGPEAVEAASRAVDLWEELAAHNPAHNRNLVTSLEVYSYLLGRMGERRQSWKVGARAATLQQRLAARDFPNTDLVDELVDHAATLLPNRQWDSTAHAVTFWESSAADLHPHDPGIAAALTASVRTLAETGQHQAALDTAARAAVLWETLAQDDPPTRDNAFVAALTACAAQLARTGHHEEAAACSARAHQVRQAAHDAHQKPALSSFLSSVRHRRSQNKKQTTDDASS